jgi:hypothetical protein
MQADAASRPLNRCAHLSDVHRSSTPCRRTDRWAWSSNCANWKNARGGSRRCGRLRRTARLDRSGLGNGAHWREACCQVGRYLRTRRSDRTGLSDCDDRRLAQKMNRKQKRKGCRRLHLRASSCRTPAVRRVKMVYRIVAFHLSVSSSCPCQKAVNLAKCWSRSAGFAGPTFTTH